MSTERDPLTLATEALASRNFDAECGDTWTFDNLPAEIKRGWLSEALKQAKIVAAHFEPRQVTTVEELDALPVDSVVMESEQDTFIIRTMRGVFHRFPDGWYVVAGHGARTNIELPATVLHVGGAE